MTRALLPLLAAAFVAVPAGAATYSARPAAPTSDARIITRDIAWRCGPAACQGATEESRPAVICQSLAKRAGRIESFIVNGRAFAPAELDKCNTAARVSEAPLLATR